MADKKVAEELEKLSFEQALEKLEASVQELEDGQLQVIGFFAKWARGAMARYAVEERLEDPEGLKAFTAGDYRFQPELSDDSTWVFTRPKPPPVNG